MANYTVIGVGQHKKFFDGNAYHDATNYIFNPEKAAYIVNCPRLCGQHKKASM